MDYENIEVIKNNKVATVYFNRPDSLNSWNEALVDELTDFLNNSKYDDDTRVIVLTGKGRAFSVGGDLQEFLAFDSKGIERFNRKVIDLFRLLEHVRKPIIAAVNGHCNLETIQAVDMVVASSKAKFGLPEVNVAISPGAGILVRLPRIVGKLKAKEIALLGEWMTADTAMSFGLVNWVKEPDELMAKVEEISSALSEKAPLAMGAIKSVVNNGAEMSIDEGMEYQLKENSSLFYTDDLKEGIKAFLEKRKANYSGK
ncbi:hypothetical protein IX51_02985 [uncultured archaeon]|nr:hypothetical protein IX51_02985 [uncultured archaeon]